MTTSIELKKQEFELSQRQATALSSSNIVPTAFQNNPGNCLIALEMADRMNLSPMLVMQNLDIIHGKPSFSSKFLIARVNNCGLFSPLRFKFEGTPNTPQWGCRAVSTDLKTGEEITGPLVTLQMAKSEGWYDKKGSKWQTMPELMLQYRAGAFFARLYAPETTMGLMTSEEIRDIQEQKKPSLNEVFQAPPQSDVVDISEMQ